jgi:hypothetical protein
MMKGNRQIMKRYLNRRMLILGGIALAYLLVLVLWGSPLLALANWLGMVDPATQPAR